MGSAVTHLYAESSFSQGAEWRPLIRTYIHTIPLSGDAPWTAEQTMSCEPSKTVTTAMTAKAGAAARHSQSPAPHPGLARHSSVVLIAGALMFFPVS
jgi:hypothetical protein